MKFRNSGRIRHFGDHSGHIDLFFRSAVAFAASFDLDWTYNPRDSGTHRFPVFKWSRTRQHGCDSRTWLSVIKIARETGNRLGAAACAGTSGLSCARGAE